MNHARTSPVAPGAAAAAAALPPRIVTAASLFDGHDAAINMIRRLLQRHGAEVIHLGHNRSVADLVRAAVQEDADALAISSYQGGHNEYFRYLIDQLRAQGVGHVRVLVGGGGTISPDEIQALQAYGVERIYTPEDGRTLGLEGMIGDLMRRVAAPTSRPPADAGPFTWTRPQQLARAISALESARGGDATAAAIRGQAAGGRAGAPVLGMTGTGGAGKSSLTDELLQRFLRHFPQLQIAVIAMDPTRRRSGGALLGDRIRMNALSGERIFMRSLATRRQHRATSAVLQDVIGLLSVAGFDLILVETAGIGQSDSEIADLVDLPVYVMTSEYGAASQLEKIDMLDYAELIALNKFEKRGGEDALRDIRKQWRRNHAAQRDLPDEQLPVFPTIASRFNDPGVDALFGAICGWLERHGGPGRRWQGRSWQSGVSAEPVRLVSEALIPAGRSRYLAEIAANGRRAGQASTRAAAAAHRAGALYEALQLLADPQLPPPFEPSLVDASGAAADASVQQLRARYNEALTEVGAEGLGLLKAWPEQQRAVCQEHYSFPVRGRAVNGNNYSTTLSQLRVPKIAAPAFRDWGEILKFLLSENLPGHYPYVGGVYPYRREGEEPTRMFAGEGGPERTNRRFHYLARGHRATRLSTAFDSITLYGEDPDIRPDIYGRIGNSGVSVASLDDLKKLYSGFDLCAPDTSVSMTINGPAPILLAMFMNAAIDQRIERHLRESGGWPAAEQRIQALRGDAGATVAAWSYRGTLPEGHDGSGLGLLGVSGDQLVDEGTYERLKAEVLAQVRGTVQADILKEDQAQNTCIFSTEFALRMMGDIQQYFIDQQVRNFYSVSISGYHIAEAGANPVTQLAFTLANGFTIAEYYRARGMRVDDFAPNLSFFFSNGMEPEYAVIGRVARRIWARAMRDLYQAGPRSQMLKYHIQTSGRSLHAQEIQFNDIRTTLQALYALFDNCNSLHTNAYDEALTTPTEESVRRAVAIQLIINRELGLNRNQNPWQGSFLLEYLTDQVEEAVYREFDALADRGGVLGAMETMYQRSKIQEESLYYEQRKHDGSLPLVGVNTFLADDGGDSAQAPPPLIRSSDREKDEQVASVAQFRRAHSGTSAAALDRLRQVACSRANVFAELMQAVKVCSLGQITETLYAAGGRYRRNM